MIDLDAILVASALAALCSAPAIVEAIDPPIYYKPPPAPAVAADIPVSMRFSNYSGGSCMWAGTQTALAQGGRHDMAMWCRRNFSGAAGIEDIERMFAKSKTPYKSTVSGQVEVLDMAHRTRRHAAIYYYPGHAVTFIGWGDRNGQKYAILLDNNYAKTGKYDWIRKEKFLSNWRGRFGGGAIVPLYDPVPQRPYNPFDFEVKK